MVSLNFMKVLFLDVDGVLNCSTTKERCKFPDGGGGLLGVEQSKCELVRKIVRETGCHIVLSSTWRKHRDMLPYLWSELQLRDKWVGSTPELPPQKIDTFYRSTPRGDEIAKWISDNPECDRFVILDDDSDMSSVIHRLVNTDFRTGLTIELAEKAIAMLNE
jgi:hypothetical protein